MNRPSLVASVLILHSYFQSTASFVHQQHPRCRGSTAKEVWPLFAAESSSSSSSPLSESPLLTTATEQPQRTRRRPRYQGKYPRQFHEKYKELQGDQNTVQKVLQKGMTPAGTHVPIMLNECLQYLGLQQGDSIPSLEEPIPTTTTTTTTTLLTASSTLVVDCTLGYGGHASHLLQAMIQRNEQSSSNTSSRHRLVALDQDAIELPKTEARLRATYNLTSDDKVLTTVHQNFCTLGDYLQSTNETGRVTSLLADLGLSSMQIDNQERGFTYKRTGPLDMRMNTDNASAETAYDLLCRLTPAQFKALLEENSDEIYAKEIAQGLLGKKKKSNNNNNKKKTTEQVVIPQTTTELADRVRAIVEPLMQDAEFLSQKAKNGSHQKALSDMKIPKAKLDSTVARVMQALRIELNGEFRALEQLLADLPSILAAPGGRAVFLTFHSGEDRRVKKAFKAGYKSGIYSSWSRHVVRPSAQERRDNPRSSCCKLRWVVRSDQVI